MKKIAIMIDSEIGWTEKQARDKGFNFVPIILNIDGKEGYSGIDYSIEWMYDHLTKETKFKTAASELGMIQNEYRKALKTAKHVIFIPISKHLSSQINTARLAADEEEFNGKVTVWDSEYIGPWLLGLVDYLMDLMKKDAEKEEFLKALDLQTHHMFGWIFPDSLDRAYASGRMSKAQYITGNLLKITPVLPVTNGSISGTGMIKTRSKKKAIKAVVEQICKKFDEFQAEGKDAAIMTVSLGYENEDILNLEKEIIKTGYHFIGRSWIPSAIVGHVGVGGAGAGITILPYKGYLPTEAMIKKEEEKK